jgi:hypothetical protein
MYYVVSFQGRCMGFCTLESKAQDLVRVFGSGSRYEQTQGTFPTDEALAARQWESKQKVRPLSSSDDATTVQLSPAELAQLRAATAEAPTEAMPEDPWEENTQIRSIVAPGESGFFVPVTQAG